MENELQFDQGGRTGTALCGSCQSGLQGSYFQFNGHTLCAGCADAVRNQFSGKSGGFLRLVRATILGLGGGLAGGAVYTAVLALAQINAALITILIGWLVGKGVNKGCGGRGGIGYQILAVFITYLVIGLSATLADVLTSDVAEGSLLNAIVICVIGAFTGPVFMATSSILGGIITLFGLLQAWQINKAPQVEITGPHALAPATAEGSADETSFPQGV